MSSLNIQIRNSLYKSLQRLVEQDRVSMDQFVAVAIAEKMAALTTERDFQERANRGDRGSYEAVLAKVPDVET